MNKIIIFNIILLKIINCQIIFPFFKYNNIEYPDRILKNNIFSELNIGNPPQKTLINFNFELFSFFISSKNKTSKGYNEHLSNKFKKIDDSIMLIYYEDERSSIMANYVCDLFTFKNIETNLTFYLAFGFSKNENIINGSIGLNFINKRKYSNEENFIFQLHKKNLIKETVFSIIYNNNNNKKKDFSGSILIGNYPHEIDKNFDIENFKFINSEINFRFETWGIFFNSIEYENKIDDLNYASLNNNIEGIIGSRNYQNFLYEKYFKNYINKKLCKEQNFLNNQFIVYVCKKEIDYLNFSSIYFNHDLFNFSFVLESKDLWIENNNEIYFMIVFSTKITNSWTLGEIFLRKYKFVFDLDRKIIGFYNENNKNIKNQLYNKIIIFLLFFIFFTLLFLFLFKLYKNRPRKIHANELIENYDYSINKENYTKIN